MTRKPPLRFIDRRPFWSEWMPSLFLWYLRGTMAMDTAGSEVRVPATGPLVVVTAPHAGWLEPMVVETCFQRAGRPGPLWITKVENRGLPRGLFGDHLIAIDRDRPEPSVMRDLYQVLGESISPSPALATSIEGTRFGNPDDRTDLRTLGPFKSGIVRVAMRTGTPILPVVVLGAEGVMPYLGEAYKKGGVLGAFRELQRARAHPHPVTGRCLPVYEDHLSERESAPGGRLRERAEGHAQRLRERVVAEILALDPGFPV